VEIYLFILNIRKRYKYQILIFLREYLVLLLKFHQ
jgi:hypothetical protein